MNHFENIILNFETNECVTQKKKFFRKMDFPAIYKKILQFKYLRK